MRPEQSVFAEPWEAQAFALAVALSERGLFTWAEWTARFARALKAAEASGGEGAYYRAWLDTVEALTIEKRLLAPAEIHDREHEWEEAAAATPHGQPIVLRGR